ncbi:phosphatidate cytidylyltransferase [Entomospira culicis]|uniref:Phosphatidate cytidylyltransferase n=1 Tax=Entomospira culicis TaxID=2719989 RepID=A0A968GGW0_9SPIO|nr:phosphatidate cytidylyltransferase [Entomospira culicis]NIZ19494.1 phosphatidate cytidylyltransferase [Entomospira culicis]NIZ69601.1 phosphatidate cytidylyltransferase [Entomospira culicis]WDI36712.1 phosphatidate cytidylyltransferase [Entomospira culicis]WDI38341.1 phosphatidate cytidylyltransferase [Entomospira culicis]
MKALSNFAIRNIAAVGWTIFLLLIVFVFKSHNHLVGSITLITLSAIGTYELGKIFKHKFDDVDTLIYPLLGAYFPVMSTLEGYFASLEALKMPMLAVILSLIFAKQTLVANKNKMDSTITRITAMVFALFYPGFFVGYFVKLNTFHHSSTILAVYLLLITLNDGMAYYVGRAFGKKTHSQGIFMVSPNKSLVGFIGGLTASMLVALIAYLYLAPKFAPQMFGERGVIYALAMGLTCGIASIIGDLFESTLKRSSDVKDSGDIIPGRGGVLDTIDSLAFVAPIYYLFIYFA